MLITNSWQYQKEVLSMLDSSQQIIQAKENYIIEYTVQSRGIYSQIKIDKNNIYTLQKRDDKPIIKNCGKKYWNNIMKYIQLIDVQNISTLKAPSKKFQFDGSAIAYLKITHSDKTYKTSDFDHGNPPEEIALLVKVILSNSENIE